LRPLAGRLQGPQLRPKQINDAIWGSVELLPWEVGLVDTPLLQRMRGVRQLGLANLVFPGASHDRLEHIIGVVGAIERMISALNTQIDRWNRDDRNKARQLPPIAQADRHRLRLAALFHDLGHGPFSHAIEPVLEVTSPLGTPDDPAGTEGSWRQELRDVRSALKSAYLLNSEPATSEIIAVEIVLSEPIATAFANDKLFSERWASVPEMQEQLVACIIGALDGPGADHLSSLISSQLDADRLDYLSRDSHHAGLNIGFDTDRLLSRMEVLQMRDDNTPGADEATKERLATHHPDPVLQIGIAASGFGSFEQMLIGRTFLYDRLYHHHKVRAAEAMAQRMLLVAERDRGERLSLAEIFLSVGDDTLIRLVSEEITHPKFPTKSVAAADLAQALVQRQLLHRAFAFRARLVSTPPGLSAETADQIRNEQWRRLLKGLATLGLRYDLGEEIYRIATEAADILIGQGIKGSVPGQAEALRHLGPEHIIVDVPGRKADAIRIMARHPDGTLKVPEFSFNPVKWADAYDLQKRTGYVFCPREVVPIIALASGIVFLLRFGIAFGAGANALIKAGETIDNTWIETLVAADFVDNDVADYLQKKRHSLLQIQLDDLSIPESWITEDPDFGTELAAGVKKWLRAGLTADALQQFRDVMTAMFAFMDMWYSGSDVTGNVEDEADLQGRLLSHFRSRGLKVEEGSVVGGGKLDLFVNDTVLIENKFKDETQELTKVAPAAGMQARRYAIALSSQLILTVAAVRVQKGQPVPQKSDMIEVRAPGPETENRVEIRFTVPYGAVVPSSEKAPKKKVQK